MTVFTIRKTSRPSKIQQQQTTSHYIITDLVVFDAKMPSTMCSEIWTGHTSLRAHITTVWPFACMLTGRQYTTYSFYTIAESAGLYQCISLTWNGEIVFLLQHSVAKVCFCFKVLIVFKTKLKTYKYGLLCNVYMINKKN